MILYIISIIFFFVSFLNPTHYVPWVAYDSEQYAVIGLIFLFFAEISRKILFYFNKLFLFLFLFLFLTVLVQFYFKIITFQKFSILFYYLFTCFLSLCLGVSLKNKYSDVLLEKKIINSVVFISFISLIIGFFQSFFIRSYFILDLAGNRWYSNIGQSNHFSTILCMGVYGLTFYESNNKNNKLIVNLILISFIFGVFKTGSLTGYLMIFIMPFTLIFINLKKYYFTFYYPILLFFYITLDKWTQNSIDATSKLNSNNSRFVVWRDSIDAIFLNPQGYGWLNGAQGEILTSNFYDVLNYSHNLFLDIILWNGVFLGFILVSFFIYVFVKLFFNKNKLFLIILPIMVHSFFEYPLYYMYFLIPFFIILGILIFDFFSKKIDFKINFLIFLFFFFIYIVFSLQINSDFRRLKTDAYFSSFGECRLNGENVIILKDLKDFTLLPCYIESRDDKVVEILKLYPYKVFIEKYLKTCDQDCNKEILDYYHRKF